MSKIFSLSEAGSIAIHGMVLIARSEDQVSVNDISERTGSSRHHVAKVMQRLVKEDFLHSLRGPSGGFKLKKPAETISLLEIYEAIEGKIEITDCPMNNEICPVGKCIFDNVLNSMSQNLRDYFQTQKLSEYIPEKPAV